MSSDAKGAAKLAAKVRIKPGSKVKLTDHDPGNRLGLRDKETANALLAANRDRIELLQERLMAERKRSLLVVLQGIDAAGKEGTTRAVFSGVNPQGCEVTSFKAPTAVELDHDYLWRIHHAAPPHGHIGIFNRSHYEDVLVVRVDSLVPEKVWSARYEQINAFEKLLVDNGTEMVKICLLLSKEEQAERLRERITNPEKRWKFSPDDLRKRKQWDEYMSAYEELLHRCSTDHAPWYVVPADRNWVRNVTVSAIVRSKLEEMDPKVPEPAWDPSVIVVE